ncbi:MAG: 50S ribosomal protein L11 methyltransferase [Pseudomonadales bacterium]|nr:50S ribosomal protein L11 methyltransferase [Pseudomonadales bacterium]
MSWVKLSFNTTKNQLELLEDVLLGAGALTVSLEDAEDQPLLEPGVGEMPLWDTVVMGALFETGVDTDQVVTGIQQNPALNNCAYLATEIVPDEDWQRVWMDRFQPMCFGRRLWICPSWSDPVDATAVNLMLDPGLAFGTGTHPTTELCLKWLDSHMQPNWTALDYGCGSGVLAIASALLGAKMTLAVDNDPQAILATRENALLNRVDAVVNEMSVDEFLLSDSGQFDLVMANILAGPLIELAPFLAAQLRQKGCLILSGVLEEQMDDVVKAYSSWCQFEEPEIKEGWVLLKGHRFG